MTRAQMLSDALDKALSLGGALIPTGGLAEAVNLRQAFYAHRKKHGGWENITLKVTEEGVIVELPQTLRVEPL